MGLDHGRAHPGGARGPRSRGPPGPRDTHAPLGDARRPRPASGARSSRTGCSWPGSHPCPRARAIGRVRRGAGPLRTCFERDRDRILHGTTVPTAGRQDPGRSSSRRTTSAPGSPTRSRSPRSPQRSLGRRGSTSRSPRRSRSATTAATAPAATPREDAFSPYRRRRLRPCGLGRRRGAGTAQPVRARPSTGSATTPGHVPRRRHPRARSSSWADRIAYVCHDLEDAVARRHRHRRRCCPTSCASAAGDRRSQRLGRVHRGVIDAIASTGTVCMSEPMAEALAAFRALQLRAHLHAAGVAGAVRVGHRGAAGPRRVLRPTACPAAIADPRLATAALEAGSRRRRCGAMPSRYVGRHDRPVSRSTARLETRSAGATTSRRHRLRRSGRIGPGASRSGRTSTSLRSRREPNFTWPSAVAKSVSSPPCRRSRRGGCGCRAGAR